MLADDLIVFNCELNRIGLNKMQEETKDVRKQNLVMTLLLLKIITFTKEPIDQSQNKRRITHPWKDIGYEANHERKSTNLPTYQHTEKETSVYTKNRKVNIQRKNLLNIYRGEMVVPKRREESIEEQAEVLDFLVRACEFGNLHTFYIYL